jgi:hypothetical protein
MIGSVDVGCVYRGSDLHFNIVFMDWGDSVLGDGNELVFF